MRWKENTGLSLSQHLWLLLSHAKNRMLAANRGSRLPLRWVGLPVCTALGVGDVQYRTTRLPPHTGKESTRASRFCPYPIAVVFTCTNARKLRVHTRVLYSGTVIQVPPGHWSCLSKYSSPGTVRRLTGIVRYFSFCLSQPWAERESACCVFLPSP